MPNVGSTIFEPEEGKEGNAGSLYTPKSVLTLPPVVAVHGRLVREADPDPTRPGPRVRVVGAGRERVFVSERSVDGWRPA